MLSFYDELTMSFKTRKQSGLLFHAGLTTDYMSLSLVDGTIVFSILLKENEFKVEFEPNRGVKSYADNQWHTIRVKRNIYTVSSKQFACMTAEL